MKRLTIDLRLRWTWLWIACRARGLRAKLLALRIAVSSPSSLIASTVAFKAVAEYIKENYNADPQARS